MGKRTFHARGKEKETTEMRGENFRSGSWGNVTGEMG